MEIMSRAVVKTRTLKPLPSEITSAAINGATLPVKIEACRRAIAECNNLEELLRYKSVAEGLAAAIRIMKDVGPEMVRAANCLVADSWIKGGELLDQYSNVPPVKRTPNGTIKKGGSSKSERIKIATELGLSRDDAAALVRISKAPLESAYAAANSTSNLRMASGRVPLTDGGLNKGPRYSDALRGIMGVEGKGLVTALSSIKHIDMSNFKHLTPDERKTVKAKITEIMEVLDEMDRLCR
jgi:hypothetical protein